MGSCVLRYLYNQDDHTDQSFNEQAVIQVPVGLIFLGASASFNAFVDVAVICLGASYAMPVFWSVPGQSREMCDDPYSRLGRWGYFIHWLVVLLCLP